MVNWEFKKKCTYDCFIFFFFFLDDSANTTGAKTKYTQYEDKRKKLRLREKLIRQNKKLGLNNVVWMHGWKSKVTFI